MQPKRTRIINGQVITPAGIIREGTVLITGETITAVSEKNIEFPGAVEIDARGKYISPGFIDLHVHGGGGCDFMDGTVEAFLTVAATHARYGTTSMLPTTLTGSRKDILKTLAVYALAHEKNLRGSAFLGMHLEGPYLAMSQRGAQDPRYIRDPDPDEYRQIVAASGSIRRWSAAPELKGAIEFGRFLTSQGILPAIAHTDAIYEEAVLAFENGFTLATHFYSAMSSVVRRNAFRYAGVVEAGYLIDEMDVEIIADGVHLPAPLLKLVYKIKGPEHTALVTDAIRAAGTNDTVSILGSRENGLPVIIEDAVAKLPDRSSFAGSVATADRLIRTMISIADVPLVDTVRMMTATPARILGIQDKKGQLSAGSDADIILFDRTITIAMTMIKGEIIYQL